MANAQKSPEILDWGIAYEVHRLIDETDIYKYNANIKAQFDLICVVIDRLHDAVNYLNEHETAPRNDDGVFLFWVYACMVHDAVKQIFVGLGLSYPCEDPGDPDNFVFFGNIATAHPLNIPKDKCPTDDRFFEYLRSMSFAHPFKTDRPKFFAEGEIQYSPFVIHGHSSGAAPGEEGSIGVRIYSNRFTDIVDLRIPYKTLLGYVKSRYEKMREVSRYIEGLIQRQEEAWRKKPINRNQTTEGLLREIVERLEERGKDSDLAKEALKYYTMPISHDHPLNEENVAQYRKIMANLVPEWCDLVDKLDHEGLISAMEVMVLPDIPMASKYQYVGYQLEKIAVHLGDSDESHALWAKSQLKSFAEGFAKEWVEIDADAMSVDEAHLLVAVACFFEFSRYEMKHPESKRNVEFPMMGNGAGVRPIIIGELPTQIKKGF